MEENNITNSLGILKHIILIPAPLFICCVESYAN
jgi:hypothetical protein